MAAIDAIFWEAKDNHVFAWKYPEANLSTFAQLIVSESQEAVLFTKGRILGKFGPGKHTLNTENLPLLRTLFGIPFGGNNPFRAEIWFVNKVMPLNIDWNISSLRYMDPDYQVMMPLVAIGRYGLSVNDAERFLVKLVGTLHEFNAVNITDNFQGALEAKTKSVILSYMQNNKIGINSISGHLEELSKFLKTSIEEFWEDYGFLLKGFYITTIDIDATNEEGMRIRDALSKKSAQNIAGYTWQQGQTFEVAEKALTQGSEIGLFGAVMLTGGAGNMSTLLTPPTENNTTTGNSNHLQAQRKDVFCSKCSKKYSTSNKFCPHCGDPYVPCPRCGTDNAENAKRCVNCGTYLTDKNSDIQFANKCGSCGEKLESNSKFCPNCGKRVDSV